ncbi:unnamed protein product [Darwinula stevensoni]|uniref:DDE Tnp4 domain-containing protein n=1 Tax=Darwinula stevensoni TaxID=69355 RepID=A0A7R9AAY1_9CRUS|nr:unnamed protein product [Darwinula stevensoni]CAG0898860.1 unnamed protein product [Darwinula stevensoni]
MTNSHLYIMLERSPNMGIILGDSAYPARPYLMTPLSNPQTQQEFHCNSAHSSTRIVIERAFGQWKRRFHCLHSELRMEPRRVCTVVNACAVLHNLCKSQHLADFQDILPDDSEPPSDPPIANTRGTSDIRSFFIQQYF